jgi:hypothetical protein
VARFHNRIVSALNGGKSGPQPILLASNR